MLAFLSDPWIEALDHAATDAGNLAELTVGMALVIEQEVVDGDRTVTYHVVIDDGRVSVRPGPAPTATVRFSQDADTARAVAAGELSAQRAFMTGRLRVGGDLTVLLAHGEALAELDDVFASVRARTDLGAAHA